MTNLCSVTILLSKPGLLGRMREWAGCEFCSWVVGWCCRPDTYKRLLCLAWTQFKVLHRVHFSKARQSEIYPNVDDGCERCHTSCCHLSHLFFCSPRLHSFWHRFLSVISNLINTDIETCSLIAAFGVPKDRSLVYIQAVRYSSLYSSRSKATSATSLEIWQSSVCLSVASGCAVLLKAGKNKIFCENQFW